MDEKEGRHMASSVVIKDATHSVRQRRQLCTSRSNKILTSPLQQIPQEKPDSLASAIWEAIQYDKHSTLSKL